MVETRSLRTRSGGVLLIATLAQSPRRKRLPGKYLCILEKVQCNGERKDVVACSGARLEARLGRHTPCNLAGRGRHNSASWVAQT